MRTFIVSVGTSVLLLVGIVSWAQTRVPIPGPTGPIETRPPALRQEPAVLTGEDIGIRLTGSVDANGRVQGTLVAKINGRWVDVTNTPNVVR